MYCILPLGDFTPTKDISGYGRGLNQTIKEYYFLQVKALTITIIDMIKGNNNSLNYLIVKKEYDGGCGGTN